jgi:hypothetical protein
MAVFALLPFAPRVRCLSLSPPQSHLLASEENDLKKKGKEAKVEHRKGNIGCSKERRSKRARFRKQHLFCLALRLLVDDDSSNQQISPLLAGPHPQQYSVRKIISSQCRLWNTGNRIHGVVERIE